MSQYKKSEAVKTLILDSAERLFEEKGYEATTVADIIARSGLQTNRLNYYFQNKAEIAALLCKKMFRCVEETVMYTLFPMTNSMIVKDIIHIRTLLRTMLSKEPSMNFYYEIARENIITEIIVSASYSHFIQQREFLNLHYDKDTLLIYAHFFAASIVELIKARKEGDLKMPEEEALDFFNITHLKLVNICKAEGQAYLAEAKQLMKNIEYELKDMTTVRLRAFRADRQELPQ